MPAGSADPVLSLNARLTLAASVVLAGFLGLTGLALDRAFAEAGLAAVRDRLQGQVYTLLTAADVDRRGRLVMPHALPEARLAAPDSGLYARIVAPGGAVLWHSPSLLGIDIAFPPAAGDGVAAFAPVRAGDGRELYALSFAVTWETGAGASLRLAFQVAESRAVLAGQAAQFRRTLWGWLGAAAIGLLLAQGLTLRFGLAPLRRVGAELDEVEAGRRRYLSDRYPREIARLSGRINAFIDSGRRRLERSRDALGALAHSLKTPLAVLASVLETDADGETVRRTLEEQGARMRRTIDYQLQRAAASGPTPMAPAVALEPLARRIVEALAKVYADKGLSLEIDAAAGLAFNADEGDLTEILGNVLDNACKWARTRARVRIDTLDGSHTLRLRVEDDGPGIPADRLDAVLDRGVRADSATEGHGIGLAVVREIVVEVYGGRIEVGSGALGGAAVEIRLPGRPATLRP